MSSLNGFNGQLGRPGARSTAEQPQAGQQQAAPQQTAWQQPQGHYQPPGAQPAQQWAQPAAQQGFPQQGYTPPYPPAPPQAAAYGQQKPPVHNPAPQSPATQSYGGLNPNPDSYAPDAYAPSFEPFSPAAVPRTAPPARPQQAAPSYQQHAAPPQDYGVHGGYGAPDPRGSANYPQSAQAWPGQPAPPLGGTPTTGGHGAGSHGANARGFDVGNYLQQPTAQPPHQQQYRAAEPHHHDTLHQHDSEPTFSDWSQPQQHAPQGQGYDYGDAQGHHQGHHQHDPQDDLGFAQPAGGELEQGYVEEDGEEYEYEEPSRGRRPLMIAAALAGAIFVGGGLAYGYKAFLGGGATGNPPMVKSASEPSKIKPADAGGKQFAHTDSKIMGRLGDGSSAATATSTASGELDANGTRKVSTLVVGRDGSIQAPPAAAADPVTDPAGNVAVPGMMVVDALGTGAKATAAKVDNAVQTAQKLVVNPPPPTQKPVTVAKATVADVGDAVPSATGSIAPAAPAAPKPTVKKVAAAAPSIANDAATAAAPVVSGGASGYVAVLASVPRSDTSRMDALKRFADMQQKYSSVLSGKTPDVAEANLGAKGNYHRLVVGPPASRQQASMLCTDLKAQGYTDCWVTSY